MSLLDLGEDLKISWYGEWVPYENSDEREEALQYLKLWKKFFLKKCSDLQFVDDQLTDKPKIEFAEFSRPATLAIKIRCMRNDVTPESITPKSVDTIIP